MIIAPVILKSDFRSSKSVLNLNKFFKENDSDEDKIKQMIYWYSLHSSDELCSYISKFLTDVGLTRYFFSSS